MIIAPFMNMVLTGYLTNTPARILVCGGREYVDKNKVWSTLNELVCMSESNQLGHHVVIIHGGAKGADMLADQWAVCNWKPVETYPILKKDWVRFSSAAGHVRNRKMLKESKPTFVVAFPGAGGTAHMISIAKDAGLEVLEVPA